MTPESVDCTDVVRERARFLSRIEPFQELERDELERVAATIVERTAIAGEAVLVENGPPGTQLYVVRDGAFELIHREVTVDVITERSGVRPPDASHGSVA